MSIVLQPLGARLLVEPLPLPEQHGLIITPNRRESAIPARVLRVGPEVRDCAVGQTILIPALSGQEVGPHRIIAESVVLGFQS